MNEDLLNALENDPLTTVANFYAGSLKEHERIRDFTRKELGIESDEAIKRGFGYSDRTLGKQIPHRRIKRGRVIRNALVELGLYKANGHETMRGRVTEPITDSEGKIIGLRGHKVDRHTDGPAIISIGSNEPLALATVKHEPSPSEPTADDLTITENQITFTRDDRTYRIRGLDKNKSTCTLKVSIMVSRDSLVHLDSLDLVKARSRSSFIKAAATELFTGADTIKKDIGQLLLKLETLQAERIDALKKPKAVEVKLSESERSEALALLQDPNLLERIVSDMDACGMVGESTNKLAGYLAAISRKLSKPLAVVIQSSSSAGKTSLMDAVLSMMPGEDKLHFSGMTGQSLFYLDTDQVKHKTLAISEEEGITQAGYALKLLQSEGELRHATVGRGADGRSETQIHHVEGPVQIFFTTTAMDIDEELVNRCLVLSVDESRNQTDAIQSLQRGARTFTEIQNKNELSNIRNLHQNAQRLIRPLTVCNPYAPQLTFANTKTRLRRDHVKYLTLIDTIALLHQHQRTIHHHRSENQSFDYINVERKDIAIANGLAGEVLGRSLDQLSPQTRNLLTQLHDFVQRQSKQQQVPRDAVRFTRRDVREALGLSNSQLSVHLNRLVEMEYVYAHRGRNGQRYVYELLYAGEGREGQPFLMGLIDPAKLKQPVAMIGNEANGNVKNLPA